MAAGIVEQLRHVWSARKLPAGHATVLVRDLLNLPARQGRHEDGLGAAIQWLTLAQDESGCDGVCGAYDLFRGWQGPSVSASAQILPTLIRTSDELNRRDLAVRARRMLDWLVGMQFKTGAYFIETSEEVRQRTPAVLTTGHAILALLSGFRHLGTADYLAAAIRSADWLCDVQERKGSWRVVSADGRPNAAHAGAAWALIALGLETARDRYVDAGDRHLGWLLRQQRDDGWIRHVHPDENGMTHLGAIVGTVRGLWEGGVQLADRTCVNAARTAIDVLVEHVAGGRLGGAYRAGWRRQGSHLCLPGHAQLACLLMRLHAKDHDRRWLEAAMTLIQQLCQHQDLDNPSEALRGGLRGSYPITGPYMPMAVVTWGTGFLVDALLLQQRCLQRERVGRSQAVPAVVDHAPAGGAVPVGCA